MGKYNGLKKKITNLKESETRMPGFEENQLMQTRMGINPSNPTGLEPAPKTSVETAPLIWDQPRKSLIPENRKDTDDLFHTSA